MLWFGVLFDTIYIDYLFWNIFGILLGIFIDTLHVVLGICLKARMFVKNVAQSAEVELEGEGERERTTRPIAARLITT